MTKRIKSVTIASLLIFYTPIMSLNALALALALSGEAEAKVPEIDAASVMRQCPVAENTTIAPTRSTIREQLAVLEAGLPEALREPSKAEMVRALAYELYGQVNAQVSTGELDTRGAEVAETLQDQLSDRGAVDDNRAKLHMATVASEEDSAYTDLVLNDLKPDNLRKDYANWDAVASSMMWQKAEDLAKEFAGVAGVDCTQAIVYAQRNGGQFPGVETDFKAFTEPNITLELTPDFVPSPAPVEGGRDWKVGLGREEQERVTVEEMIAELKKQVAKGMERFARRYNLEEVPAGEIEDLNLEINVKPAVDPNAPAKK